MKCWRPADATEAESLTICPFQAALSAYIRGYVCFVRVCVRIENPETLCCQNVSKAMVEQAFTSFTSVEVPLHYLTDC